MEPEQRCPECGRLQRLWGDVRGYGLTYCCRECAETGECGCKHENNGANRMNWDQIQGNWMQFRGKIKEQWGKITDDELDVINGHREQLAGKIQERYGIAIEEAERQIDKFCRACS